MRFCSIRFSFLNADHHREEHIVLRLKRNNGFLLLWKYREYDVFSQLGLAEPFFCSKIYSHKGS